MEQMCRHRAGAGQGQGAGRVKGVWFKAWLSQYTKILLDIGVFVGGSNRNCGYVFVSNTSGNLACIVRGFVSVIFCTFRSLLSACWGSMLYQRSHYYISWQRSYFYPRLYLYLSTYRPLVASCSSPVSRCLLPLPPPRVEIWPSLLVTCKLSRRALFDGRTPAWELLALACPPFLPFSIVSVPRVTSASFVARGWSTGASSVCRRCVAPRFIPEIFWWRTVLKVHVAQWELPKLSVPYAKSLTHITSHSLKLHRQHF